MKKNTKNSTKTNLPFKQELFCRYWVENNGNKTLSALLAFDMKNKELGLIFQRKQEFPGETELEKEKNRQLGKTCYYTAGALGCEYYNKPKVRERINELLDQYYFTDDFVKQQHFKILAQDKDLSNKKGGIELYYKLKNKFTDNKVEINLNRVDIPDYQNLSLEEIKRLEAEIVKNLSKK